MFKVNNKNTRVFLFSVSIIEFKQTNVVMMEIRKK